MAESQGGETSGTIVRGADGSLYFLRSEMLEACRVTEDDIRAFCEQLLEQNDEVQGFSLTAGPVNRAVAFQGPFSPANTFNVRATSTVMCPGTFTNADFRVLPATNFSR